MFLNVKIILAQTTVIYVYNTSIIIGCDIYDLFGKLKNLRIWISQNSEPLTSIHDGWF